MQTNCNWQLATLASTEHIAHCIAKSLIGTETIYIYGNLGSGKTTLCRNIIQSAGYTGTVKSPTYTIIESYKIKNFCIHHLDLYRITDAEELYYIGVDEQLFTGVSLIEWPDKGNGVIKAVDLKIYMSYTESGRSIKLNSSSQIGLQLLSSIRSLVNFKD